jgi:hypothetical protein
MSAGRFDVSQTGTLVYVSGKPLPPDPSVAVMDSRGTQTLLPGAAGMSLHLSPDGSRVAYSASGDIFVYTLATQSAVRITFDPAAPNRHPAWSPDGRYLAYAGVDGIWWTRADGGGKPVRIVEDKPSPSPWSMAAGKEPHAVRIAYHAAAGTGDLIRDVVILPLDLTDPEKPSPGKPERFANGISPALSPDGRWIAYNPSERAALGTTGVFVQRYRPGLRAADAGKWQIGNGTMGVYPVWSRAGNQLFFRDLGNQIMVQDFTISGDTFVPGAVRQWSPTGIIGTGAFQNFDIFPDGKRAVVVALSEQYSGGATGQRATFIVNFFDELKRKLP